MEPRPRLAEPNLMAISMSIAFAEEQECTARESGRESSMQDIKMLRPERCAWAAKQRSLQPIERRH